MKLIIHGTGHESEQWAEVEYTVIAESKDYKTTVSFWDNDNPFDNFAQQLLKFPFENKKDVVFKGDGITMKVHLVDPAGRTAFQIETNDQFNRVRFEDLVEVAALEKLSRILTSADFAKPVSVEWQSTI